MKKIAFSIAAVALASLLGACGTDDSSDSGKVSTTITMMGEESCSEYAGAKKAEYKEELNAYKPMIAAFGGTVVEGSGCDAAKAYGTCTMVVKADSSGMGAKMVGETVVQYEYKNGLTGADLDDAKAESKAGCTEDGGTWKDL